MLSPQTWMRVAGVSGALAVTLGAIGSHAIVPKSDNMKDIWKTASFYHFIHTLALGMGAMHFTGRKRDIVCGLFTFGMILFSGSCYAIVYLDEKKPLSSLTPIGGTMLIAGWGAIALL